MNDHLLRDAASSDLFDSLLLSTLPDGCPIAPRELAALMHHESAATWDTLRRNCIARGEPRRIEGTLTWLPLDAQLLNELRGRRV